MIVDREGIERNIGFYPVVRPASVPATSFVKVAPDDPASSSDAGHSYDRMTL